MNNSIPVQPNENPCHKAKLLNCVISIHVYCLSWCTNTSISPFNVRYEIKNTMYVHKYDKITCTGSCKQIMPIDVTTNRSHNGKRRYYIHKLYSCNMVYKFRLKLPLF